MSRRKTREEFIEKANEIHNNLYDYSLVEYINNTSKVKIVCSAKPIGYHQMKTDRCASKGIELMHVWERDWMTNKESVLSQVAEALL